MDSVAEHQRLARGSQAKQIASNIYPTHFALFTEVRFALRLSLRAYLIRLDICSSLIPTIRAQSYNVQGFHFPGFRALGERFLNHPKISN